MSEAAQTWAVVGPLLALAFASWRLAWWSWDRSADRDAIRYGAGPDEEWLRRKMRMRLSPFPRRRHAAHSACLELIRRAEQGLAPRREFDGLRALGVDVPSALDDAIFVRGHGDHAGYELRAHGCRFATDQEWGDLYPRERASA